MGQRHHGAPEPETDVTQDEATDELFAVLANANRRFVLSHLSRREDDVALDALAAALADWSDELTEEDARIALHHVHLPKLADLGLAEYDESGVRLTDDAAASLSLVDGL